MEGDHIRIVTSFPFFPGVQSPIKVYGHCNKQETSMAAGKKYWMDCEYGLAIIIGGFVDFFSPGILHSLVQVSLVFIFMASSFRSRHIRHITRHKQRQAFHT